MRTAIRLCSMLLASTAIVAAPGRALAQYAPPGVYLPPPPPPGVYFHPRVRWRHHPPVIVINAPPPVWIAPQPPSPPPPPVYYTPPPQPIYVQPQPIYVQPPMVPPTYVLPAPAVLPPPPVVVAPPRPQWASTFGFGASFEGDFDLKSRDYKGYGIMGQLRFRAARHFGLELMGGWQRSTNTNAQVRTDVPVSFGMWIPFLGPEHVLSPYLVGGFGLNFADLRILDAPTLKIDDSRTQALAQIGFGLELRLGQHFAINGDARIEGRWSIDHASDAVLNTTSVDGKPVTPIQDSYALRLGVGATLYF